MTPAMTFYISNQEMPLTIVDPQGKEAVLALFHTKFKALKR
jgi:hypothetical protein